MTDFKPLQDYVVVEPSKAEGKSPGGIVLPDVSKKRSVIGTVIAAGPGKRDDRGAMVPMNVCAGDRVLYGNYSGTEIELDGDAYLIMHQDEIFGVLRAKKAVKAG